jgi:hypothetical protein
MLLPVCEGSALFGIGAAPLAVPLDRCVPVPEFRILSRTSGFGISPGFRLFSVVPGSWVFSGPVPVLVPVPVDSLAELLKVLVEKLRRFRRCFWEIPEFDLDRIEGSDESRFGDFGHSTDSTVPEFLDLDWIEGSDESRFGDLGYSPDSTDSGGFAENRPSGCRCDKFRILLGDPFLPDCSRGDLLLASAAAGCAIAGRPLA